MKWQMEGGNAISLQNWAKAREQKYAVASLFTMVSTVKSSLIHQGILDQRRLINLLYVLWVEEEVCGTLHFCRSTVT